jgi:hypothetical protein
MTSEIQMAYGSLVSRQGSSRAFSSNHSPKAVVSQLIFAEDRTRRQAPGYVPVKNFRNPGKSSVLMKSTPAAESAAQTAGLSGVAHKRSFRFC